MKKAYIVLAHKAPGQVARLIGRLDDGKSFFYIHVDRRSDQESFRRALVGVENLRFVQREQTGWGGVGIVRATLNGLKAVCDSGEKFDFIHLLSGQDYPLRSNAVMDEFFSAHRETIFLVHDAFPVPTWPQGGYDRIHDYHIGDIRRFRWRVLSLWVTRLANLTVVLRRRHPKNITPYAGSQWWSIPYYAAEEILSFVQKHRRLITFHQFTMAPDEIFFQTILLNIPSNRIRRNIVNDNLRFVDWDHPNPNAPAVLTRADFPRIIESGKIFARKFDVDRDAEILELIDAHLLRSEPRARESVALA